MRSQQLKLIFLFENAKEKMNNLKTRFEQFSRKKEKSEKCLIPNPP